LVTFSKIDHFSWLKFIDFKQENTVIDSSEKEQNEKELLRQKRLAYYSSV
jgi:hypothetical protein